jgi:predicted alpha/beta superfamily hydrolase
VYLAGSLPSVGGWKPDGLKLVRQEDGTFAGDVELAVGQTLEFKITRGTWGTVEKFADGSDRPNRQIVGGDAAKPVDVTVARWASDSPSSLPPGTVVGKLEVHTIDSRALGQGRSIRVWLPPGYDAKNAAGYDVLYMHDGQNCFDRRTSAFGNEWEIDEALTKLIAEKRIPPIIVVGIDNGGANRINELTYAAEAQRGGGQGAKYAEFLLNEVRPCVEKTYRVKTGQAHTFIGGSSLGGLASLEIARRHPKTFGGVMAMSPSVLWADGVMLKEVENDTNGLAGARVWLDIGTREGMGVQSERYVDSLRRLDEILAKHQVEHRLVIDEKHPGHTEAAWASRFPAAVEYVLDAK